MTWSQVVPRTGWTSSSTRVAARGECTSMQFISSVQRWSQLLGNGQWAEGSNGTTDSFVVIYLFRTGYQLHSPSSSSYPKRPQQRARERTEGMCNVLMWGNRVVLPFWFNNHHADYDRCYPFDSISIIYCPLWLWCRSTSSRPSQEKRPSSDISLPPNNNIKINKYLLVVLFLSPSAAGSMSHRGGGAQDEVTVGTPEKYIQAMNSCCEWKLAKHKFLMKAAACLANETLLSSCLCYCPALSMIKETTRYAFAYRLACPVRASIDVEFMSHQAKFDILMVVGVCTLSAPPKLNIQKSREPSRSSTGIYLQ